MINNLGTILVQAIGFVFIFAFFVYQVLSSRNVNSSGSKSNGIISKKTKKVIKPKENNSFGYKKKPIDELEPKRKRWFSK